MTSADLKAEVLAWLRFVKKAELVATEVGKFNADCLAVTATRVIEVEVKVSMADLRADAGKRKHCNYSRSPQLSGVPNLFYYALPPDLIDGAQQWLCEQGATEAFSKYGLLSVNPGTGMLGRQLMEIKAAEKLHTRAPDENIRRVCLLRMGSEICGLHDSLRRYRASLESGLLYLASATQTCYSLAGKMNVPEEE